jgi:hypothetical protein
MARWVKALAVVTALAAAACNDNGKGNSGGNTGGDSKPSAMQGPPPPTPFPKK